MKIAELILQFIDVLIWPSVVVIIVAFFKNEIKNILSRVKKLTLPGGTELDVVEKYLEIETSENQFNQAEKEREEILIDLINKLQIDQEEKENYINQLEEKNNRLREAYSKVNYIATSEIGDPIASKILEKCIEELPNRDQKFFKFILENIDGDTVEIAEKLDMTANQFRMKKNRVIERLRKCVKKNQFNV